MEPPHWWRSARRTEEKAGTPKINLDTVRTVDDTLSMQITTETNKAPEIDKDGYPYRFGALACSARSYLLGLITQDQFAEAVNAAHDPRFYAPIPLAGVRTFLPMLNLVNPNPAKIEYDRDSTEDDARRDDDHEYHPGRDAEPEAK